MDIVAADSKRSQEKPTSNVPDSASPTTPREADVPITLGPDIIAHVVEQYVKLFRVDNDARITPLMRADRFCHRLVSKVLYQTLVIKDWDHWNVMLANIKEHQMQQVRTLVIGHPLPNPPYRYCRPSQTKAETQHFRDAAVAPPSFHGEVDVLESNDYVEWTTAAIILEIWKPKRWFVRQRNWEDYHFSVRPVVKYMGLFNLAARKKIPELTLDLSALWWTWSLPDVDGKYRSAPEEISEIHEGLKRSIFFDQVPTRVRITVEDRPFALFGRGAPQSGLDGKLTLVHGENVFGPKELHDEEFWDLFEPLLDYQLADFGAHFVVKTLMDIVGVGIDQSDDEAGTEDEETD